jgi:YVTN family beta-propeller protein
VTYRFSLSRLSSIVLFLSLSFAAAFGQHIVTTIPVGDEPRGVAVNPFTGFIYVANVHSGTISVLNHTSLVTTIPVDTLPYVVAINARTNRIYAAGCNFLTGAGSMVIVIDGRTNKVVEDIPLNETCSLGTQGIAVNSLANRVYVSDYDDSQEVVIDGATNQILSRIDLAGGLPLGVAVDAATTQVWVALDGPFGKVDILDGATDTLKSTVIVGSGNFFVQDVAIHPKTQSVYVTSSGPPSGLYVLNASTHKTIATIPFGQFANTVAIDPLSNLVFVTDGQANTVTVINGSTNQIVSTVPLEGLFPAGIAANPVTQLVYVTDFTSGQVEIMTEKE